MAKYQNYITFSNEDYKNDNCFFRDEEIFSPETEKDVDVNYENRKLNNTSLASTLCSLRSHKYKYTITLCLLATFFLFADQNLMAPNLSAIAKEFNISQKERDAKLGGEISVAFFVVGGPIGLLAGWLTDRFPRNKMYAIVTFIGASGCLLSASATSYLHLLIARTVSGIPIGASSPILFSILSDMFPVEERNIVVSIVGCTISIGMICGQLLSGLIASYIGSTYWRLPFLIISVPTLICSIMIFLFTKEPQRASQESSVYDYMEQAVTEDNIHTETEISPPSNSEVMLLPSYKERVTWEKIKCLFTIKTNVFLLLQGIPGCVPWSILVSFMNDYLRMERGASVFEATVVVVVFNIGALVGKLVGGSVGQKVYNHRKRNVCLLMGYTTIVGTLPFIYLIIAPFNEYIFCIVAFLGGCIASVTGGNIVALVLNVNLPEMRGVANATFGLSADLGQGLGPFFIALLENVVGGREEAFTIGGLLWIVCGMLILGIYYTYEEDEKVVQKKVLQAFY